MGLTTIFLIRHGFRANWTTDQVTGKTFANIRTPTGIASDPPLTAHGVAQSYEVASHADKLQPEVAYVYTSPFYRCIQTIEPLWSRLPNTPLICDRGLGEWYGRAPFIHDTAADLTTLQKFFPSLQEKTSVIPPRNGETLQALHDRCAYAMARIIADIDQYTGKDKPISIVICGHAAPLIAMSRALTGQMPGDPNEADFDTYTCAISRFERISGPHELITSWNPAEEVPRINWRGQGVGGGWRCEVNAGVEHLKNGGERNWHFNGDESFVDMGDIGTGDRTSKPIAKGTWRL